MIKKEIQRLTSAIGFFILSGMALADTSIYGKANVSLQSSDEVESTTTELVSNASRIGLKGSEDLGGGLEAIYQFEFQVEVDDGDKNGDTFSQRNIFVGLKGGFGTVKAGKFDTPLKRAQKKVDLFNDLIGDIKHILTVNDNRADNSVSYSSPSAPVGFTLAYISKEDENIDDGISAALNYSNESLYLALAMDRDVEAEGADTIRGVAQYNLGDWQIGALVEEFEFAGLTQSTWLVSSQYKIDKWALKAQYGNTERDEDDFDANALSLGADYKLNKKVKVFTYFTSNESDDSDDEGDYVGLGMEYKF